MDEVDPFKAPEVIFISHVAFLLIVEGSIPLTRRSVVAPKGGLEECRKKGERQGA